MITTDATSYTYYGKSTDSKPIAYIDSWGKEVQISNGSFYLEMDTGKVFVFDASDKVWREL